MGYTEGDTDIDCPTNGCDNPSLIEDDSPDVEADYFCHWCGELFTEDEVEE